jgi:hypothetical protein
MAALREVFPLESAAIPSPGFTSTVSSVVFTVNVDADEKGVLKTSSPKKMAA